MAIELSNGLAWSSQEKAKQHFRDILARYADDEIISAPAEHADAEGRVECEISGVRLAEKEAHLDHAEPTFGHMVVVFRAERGWHDTIPHGVLTTPDDNQMTTTFVDPDIAEAFRQFHQDRATLRVISAKENLSRAARQRNPGKGIIRI